VRRTKRGASSLLRKRGNRESRGPRTRLEVMKHRTAANVGRKRGRPMPWSPVARTGHRDTSRIDAKRRARHDLITMAHHFLLTVVPFRHPESRSALTAFIEAVTHSDLPLADVDSVLVRCLKVLDGHTGGRLPTLVDQYISNGSPNTELWSRFVDCVDTLLRYRDINDGTVQEAIHLVNTRYAEPTLSPRLLAHTLGLPLSSLCAAFKRSTNRTIRQCLREVRLDRAAILLGTTNKSVKEVWVSVGYNHPSNFSHDFRERFGYTPRHYRAHIVRPIARRTIAQQLLVAATDSGSGDRSTVLIVDDDETTTRSVSEYLRVRGYVVRTAAAGRQGLCVAQEISPAVVLLDAQLTDMSALEFVHALRQTDACAPAIAIFTADWTLADEVAQFEALDVVVASKLCDLGHVAGLVAHLSGRDSAAGQSPILPRRSQRWPFF
jgi:AraC-like DNA-binding protein